MSKEKADQKKKNWVRHNEQIRIPRVLVVQDGKNLGEMSTRDALSLARSVGLDLVEVAPHSRPPVCQIMDYGRHMYDKSKKDKVKQQTQKEKEVSFRYVIDDNDLETKANQIKKFLAKGMKVKCVVKFKQREKAHKDLGFQLLNKLIETLKDFALVEQSPRYEGANVIARLDVVKKEVKKEAKKDSNKE
jgi:translation initiation factor IF-3